MCEIAQPGGIAKSYYVPSVSLFPTVDFTDWLSDVMDPASPAVQDLHFTSNPTEIQAALAEDSWRE